MNWQKRLAELFLSTRRTSVWCFLAAMCLASTNAPAQELTRRVGIWEAAALMCQAGDVRFPSKQTGDPAQPCDDGDMTLFNGLLCAAGDVRGCVGVAQAQDPVTGLWHRSPRIRLLGKNDRGEADSSPDMALGIELYLVKTKDIARASKWLAWLHANTPCLLSLGGGCVVQGLPKFCASENCVIRPGDYASLAATVNYLQKNAALGELPDGRLRGLLGSFSGYNEIIKLIDSNFNKPGYSEHLVGVGIFLLQHADVNSPLLKAAADRLMTRNPGNAFFSFLAERDAAQVTNEVLTRCTDDLGKLIRPLYEWQWERSNDPDASGIYAWQQSSLWDCIFMARLLRK